MSGSEGAGSYRCFGRCGRTFESLDDMVYVAGRGDRDGRHFCGPCARSLPHRPEEAYEERHLHTGE